MLRLDVSTFLRRERSEISTKYIGLSLAKSIAPFVKPPRETIFHSGLRVLTQFPKQLWYTSLHTFKLRIGSTDLLAESRHWTYLSRHRVWQSTFCASACQKRPKPRKIRIVLVIFLFIDFYLLRNSPWSAFSSRCQAPHQKH